MRKPMRSDVHSGFADFGLRRPGSRRQTRRAGKDEGRRVDLPLWGDRYVGLGKAPVATRAYRCRAAQERPPGAARYHHMP